MKNNEIKLWYFNMTGVKFVFKNHNIHIHFPNKFDKNVIFFLNTLKAI